MMAGGPVLDEKERRDYSLVCDFYIFRQLHSLSSLFFAAIFVRILDDSEPPPPVCSFVM